MIKFRYPYRYFFRHPILVCKVAKDYLTRDAWPNKRNAIPADIELRQLVGMPELPETWAIEIINKALLILEGNAFPDRK